MPNAIQRNLLAHLSKVKVESLFAQPKEKNERYCERKNLQSEFFYQKTTYYGIMGNQSVSYCDIYIILDKRKL